MWLVFKTRVKILLSDQETPLTTPRLFFAFEAIETII